MKRILGLLLLSTLSASAYASEISGVVGAALPGRLELGSETFDFDRSGLFGVRFEKDLLIVLGIENNLLFANNFLAPKGGEGSSAFYYTANLVINLPVDRVVPYFALGLGFLSRAGNSFPDVGTSFVTNWGLGVKLRELAGPFGFRLDYRRIGVRGVESRTVTTQELSTGLLFQF